MTTREIKGQECPRCGGIDTPTRIGGYDSDNRRIRQRQCQGCRGVFVTVEAPVLLDDGEPVPYSWVDELYRLRQREAARKRYRRLGGGAYRGLRTKKPIIGVAELDVKVKVKLPAGMRPDTRHGTAEPVPQYREPSVAPQLAVSIDDRIRIAKAYEEGVPTDVLARTFRVSTRTVQRYVARYGEKEAA